MPAVLLHGNPETPVIWDPLIAALERDDVVALQLPGFGCEAPAGFGATKDDYANWLVGELERLSVDGPIDLVGHDWGGGISLRAVSLRPDLVRTWASDVLGLFHEKMKWHEWALVWQTPGDGEAWFDNLISTSRDDLVTLFQAMGIPEPQAGQVVDSIDAEFARCVLALYRSAVPEQMGAWREGIVRAGEKPGLSIKATADPYTGGEIDLGLSIAERIGARTARLEGQGHWWMLGDPAGGARMLEEFWASVPAS
jgi:pimeloyl-ACP methyl ester carboxylesterase